MAVTYKNSVVSSGSGVKRKKKYYDETGKETTDPAKIEEVQRKVELGKSSNSIGGGPALTRDEYKREKRKLGTPSDPRIIAQKQAEDARIEESLGVAEETGVFEDAPDKVQLDVTESDKDVKNMRDEYKKRIEGNMNYYGRSREEAIKALGLEDVNFEIDDLIQNPESAREYMLRELQREILNKDGTLSQEVGSALEPILGDLKVFDVDIGGYVDKFARMPMQEVVEIGEQIKEVEARASSMTDSASQGEIGDPNKVLRQLDEMERSVYAAEALIKRLLIESAEMRANPEKVNIIEEELLNAKQTIFESKQRAAEGALITPSNENLFYSLNEIRNKYGE